MLTLIIDRGIIAKQKRNNKVEISNVAFFLELTLGNPITTVIYNDFLSFSKSA